MREVTDLRQSGGSLLGDKVKRLPCAHGHFLGSVTPGSVCVPVRPAASGTSHGSQLSSHGCRSQWHTAAARAPHAPADLCALEKAPASPARLTSLSLQNFHHFHPLQELFKQQKP